jgi:hypothetical protein
MAKQKINAQQLNANGAFYAYNSNATGTSVPLTTFTHVDFNAENFDRGGWYDTTTGRYTPQVAGDYVLHTFVGLLSVSDQQTLHVAIRKNGANYSWTRIKQSGSGELGGLVSTVVDANGTTDYFDVAVYTTSGATNVGGSNTNAWFTGVRAL